MDLRPYFKVLFATAALVGALLYASAAFAAPGAALATPHPIEGRSECLACHGPGSAKAAPADHAGRTNATCVACHQPQAPAAAPAASPAAAPPAPAQQVPPAQPAQATPPAVDSQPTQQTQPPAKPAGKNDTCLSCHSNKDMAFKLSDGTTVSAFVSPDAFKASVHGSHDLACTDCHSNITGFPHPKADGDSRRDFSFNMDEICQKCHSENYNKAQDGVHAQIITSGNLKAPGCTDCHGVHDIADPNRTVQTTSQTCAKCHSDVYNNYASSVHGKALLDESNVDVPTCITCHGVHNMADPRTAEFHVDSPDLCAKCHADETLMVKYGLSSKVVQTYKTEFHGVTTELYKTRYPTVWCYKAVCTDCHGVHDIRRSDDAKSSVATENLPQTCSKCHPGATANFASAWIGHYEPSTTDSPLVYYVNMFYQIIIPLMVLSLLAFIGLDIFRRVMNKLRPERK